MGSVGFGEIIFLLVLGLLVFGPEKLPGIANSVGRAVAVLRREASGTLDELKRTAQLEEFKGVADDLRDARSELRGARDALRDGITGRTPAATPATAAASESVAAQSSGPPPWDPDAT